MDGLTSDPGLTPEEFFDFASTSDDALFVRYSDDLLRMGVSSRSFQRDTIITELISGGIPPIPAADLVATMNQKFRKGRVGVFWDLENVRIDTKAMAVPDAINACRRRLSIFGAVDSINLYAEESGLRAAAESGAKLHATPHAHRVEVADKMIMVDAISFAFETQDPIVCIISCDSDFSALLSRLNMLGVRTIAVTLDGKHVRSMRSVAALTLSWPSDFVAQAHGAGRVGMPPTASGGGGGHSFLTVPGPRSGSHSSSNNNRKSGGDDDGDDGSPTTPSSSGLTAPPPRSRSPNNNVNNNATNDANTTTTTPQQLLQTAPNMHSNMMVRRSSLDFVPPTPTISIYDDSSFRSEDGDDQLDDVETVVRLLTRLVDETGNRRIRRSRLGQAVRSVLGAVNLTSLIGRAVQLGKVDTGGSGSLSWVGLIREDAVSAGTSRANTPRENNNNSNSSKSPARPPGDAAWPPQAAAGDHPPEFWLSYRLLKDRLNSQAILKLKPQQVEPFEIVDTVDSIDASRYTRRAFGPFRSEYEAHNFGSSLANASWAAPRVLKARPRDPAEKRQK